MTLSVVAGYLIGPIVGLALLVVGMRMRATDRRRPAAPAAAPAPALDDDQAAALPYPAVAPYPGAPTPGYDVGGQDGAPPRRRLRGTTFAIVGAVVLVATTMGELGFHALTDKPLPTVGLGDCVTEESLVQPGRPRPVDCALPGTMELAALAADERCPDGPIHESLYIIIGVSDAVTWCLVPNFTEGQCFRADSPETVYDVTDCNGNHADIKVTRRIDRDTGRCPDGTNPMRYPTPPRLYCLQVIREPAVPV